MGTIRSNGVFFDTWPRENVMADEDLNELFMDTFGDSRIHYAVAA